MTGKFFPKEIFELVQKSRFEGIFCNACIIEYRFIYLITVFFDRWLWIRFKNCEIKDGASKNGVYDIFEVK